MSVPPPMWALRFSATIHALNPGVQLMFRWVTRVAFVVAVFRVPEAVGVVAAVAIGG